ncbi:hypothetical protein JTE90_004517 [Oedothorax gibbosus]|uniref:Cuticle protein n=1 Tax=Oedothorax gibbosus TaxID=931172 RepID=A0AAV6VEF5_9ARAC|nr:hypothetical protein JTE90_004517 [Oedothorax gibbosus]
MIAFVALTAMLTVASAQYPYQQNHQQSQQYQPQPQQYQPQQYQAQPQQYQPQAPQHQAQPQQYQPQPQQYQPAQPARVHNPAAVHYVNIGAELAGDYKFGYDTGKGNDGQSFREETRLPDGSVQGAYGYVDETGKQRIVKYTAGKNGFQVEGDGIPKAPAAPQPAQPAPQAGPRYGYNSNQDHQGRGY